MQSSGSRSTIEELLPLGKASGLQLSPKLQPSGVALAEDAEAEEVAAAAVEEELGSWTCAVASGCLTEGVPCSAVAVELKTLAVLEDKEMADHRPVSDPAVVMAVAAGRPASSSMEPKIEI